MKCILIQKIEFVGQKIMKFNSRLDWNGTSLASLAIEESSILSSASKFLSHIIRVVNQTFTLVIVSSILRGRTILSLSGVRVRHRCLKSIRSLLDSRGRHQFCRGLLQLDCKSSVFKKVA